MTAAEQRHKVAVKRLEKPVHVEDVIDARNFVNHFENALNLDLFECIDLGTVIVDHSRHQRLGLAMRAVNRQDPEFALSLDDPSVFKRVLLLAYRTLFEHRENGAPNIKFIRFHYVSSNVSRSVVASLLEVFEIQ
jgi:hypothetical protein